jgi:hypothetical protein
VLYLLNLSSDRFRCHRSFMFVCFNVLQRAEARSRISLLVKKRDFSSFAGSVSQISEKVLQQELTNLDKSGSTLKNTNIKQLLNKIQSATSTVQGSKASLRHRRNDLQAYIIKFGVPQYI